jgi:hypothetical protein
VGGAEAAGKKGDAGNEGGQAERKKFKVRLGQRDDLNKP